MTLETRDLDSSYSKRKFAYEFTTNNNFFSCKQNYYCIVILFLCFVFLFASKDFVFPLLRWSILLFKLERIKKKKKILKIFQSILCRMDICNLFLSTNALSFDVLTILIHHFVLIFSIASQKQKFFVKRKTILSQAAWISFRILYRMDIFSRDPLFIKVGSQWI